MSEQEKPENVAAEFAAEDASHQDPQAAEALFTVDHGGENNDVQESDDSDNQSETELLSAELAEWKDKYLRLASEFDNFRKRTQKEKSEILRYSNEEMLRALLPVLDDFERSLGVMEKSDNVSAIRDGITMINHKFKNILQSKGLKPMESLNQAFDSEIHEAITSIPAPEEALKGKVIDEVEKGYYLDEKVIRFAKVVVGS
jgi:molecular chaperone GrpE